MRLLQWCAAQPSLPVYLAKVASERWRDQREEGEPQAEKGACKDSYFKAVLADGTVTEGAVDSMLLMF